jgi:hypothetical protein
VRGVALVLGLLATAGVAHAAVDPRLSARLDSTTAGAVSAVVEAARGQGLPVEPLIARALEGASRRAPSARIVSSVRNLATDLEIARDVLGASSSSAELVAGATALSAGVAADSLARLRAARPGTPLVVPLVVLTDLVTRRVPVETASAAVIAASRARVGDQELMKLRQRIDGDIRAGTMPGHAAVQRTRSLIGTFEAPPARPAGAPP